MDEQTIDEKNINTEPPLPILETSLQGTTPLPETDVQETPPSLPENKAKKPFLKKFLFIMLVIILVLGGFGLGAYFYQKKLNKDVTAKREASTYVNHITVAYTSAPLGFYPQPNEYVTINFNSYFYEGLTMFDKNMEIKPLLAQSWENPNPNTWRFRLRKDVTFQNGHKMTADDVVASFKLAIADPDVNNIIPTVVSATKVDNYTVDIKTSTPTPILVNIIPIVYILPQSLITSESWNHPIGTGPYEFVSASTDGSSFNLTRNDKYYGPKAKVKDVTFKAIADDTARLSALKKGQIDVSEEVTPTPEGTRTQDGKLIKFAISPPVDADFLIFDSVRNVSPYVKGTKTNPLKDVRVRTAMALALDTQSFINSGDFNKNDQQATQIVPPSIFGYNSSIKPLKQNVTEALALMKQAGYEKGFTLTFDTTSQQTTFQNLLKEQLAAIGINLVVSIDSPDVLQAKLFNTGTADASMINMSWLTPSGDALEAYDGVFSIGPNNFNFFSINDPQINDLIAKAKSTTDLSKRKEYLNNLAVVVNQQKYVIPLLSEVSVYDYRDGLVVISRADSMNYAYETSGAIPANLKSYSYISTVEKILHLKS